MHARRDFAGRDHINITIPQTLIGTREASVYMDADGKTFNMTTI